MLSIRSVRVLVIDDDPEAAELLEDLLVARNYEVEREVSMEGINERVKRVAYDVIISDIRLGTWSGLDVPALLGSAGVKKPLMIALSGDYGKLAEERSLAAGFDVHFSKPLEMEQLHARIQRERNQSERSRS